MDNSVLRSKGGTGRRGWQNALFPLTPRFRHPVSWPSSARASVIHPLWRANWLLLGGERKGAWIRRLDEGIQGPHYTLYSQLFSFSSRYLQQAIPKAFWGSVVQITGFLVGTLLTAWSFGSLLSAKSVTTCHQPSTNLINISCLPSHSVLALVCLQHFCY